MSNLNQTQGILSYFQEIKTENNYIYFKCMIENKDSIKHINACVIYVFNNSSCHLLSTYQVSGIILSATYNMGE